MTETPRPFLLAIGGLVALAAAMGIGRFVYTPILPLMVEALDLIKAQAGLIASANFAGYLAGALLAATKLVTGSRRAWLLGGLVLSALTTGAMAFFSSMAAFVSLRFVGGAASAFVLVFSLALVLDRLSLAGRANLSAVHFAGVGVGIAVSALLVSGLVEFRFGWRSLWTASGILSLVALAVVALWTWASGRIGIGRAFALACWIEAVGVAASVLCLATPGVLFAAVLLGGTFMGITALGLVGARRLSQRDPRRTLAIMTTAFGLGQIVGPTFAGFVHDATGSFLVPSLAAVGALFLAALLVIVVSARIP